jgi:hypothetical protein
MQDLFLGSAAMRDDVVWRGGVVSGAGRLGAMGGGRVAVR